MQLYSELLNRNIDFPEKESSPHEILDHVIRYETDAEFDFEPFICDNARVSVRCRIWDKTGREVRGFGEAAEANLRNPIAKSYPIKMAIKRGDDVYDFRGVSGVVDENHPQYGLYRFKQGFGATFTEFIGEIYIPYKPITYSLYRFSEKAFRTIRQIKRKILK